MNPTTNPNANPPARTPLTLKGRLDDLRVRAHLAGMEVQDQLEALAHEVEQLSRKATRSTKEAASKLHDKLDALEALIVRD